MGELNEPFTSRQFATAANCSFAEADGFIAFCVRAGFIERKGWARRAPGQVGGTPYLYGFASTFRGEQMKKLLAYKPSLMEELGIRHGD